jgi:hypothetical protein
MGDWYEKERDHAATVSLRRDARMLTDKAALVPGAARGVTRDPTGG